MKRFTVRIWIVVLVLMSASFACNLPRNQEQTPPTQEPVNPDTIDQLEDQLQETLENPQDGEVTVTVTQEQLTAFLASELASQNEQIFTDPVVVLTNGQVEVYGKVSQSGFQVNSKIVLQPRIDGSGDPKLDIVSMDLGAIPVPDSIRSRFESLTDDTLNRYLAEYSDEFTVTDITVSEGFMTITGVRQ